MKEIISAILLPLVAAVAIVGTYAVTGSDKYAAGVAALFGFAWVAKLKKKAK